MESKKAPKTRYWAVGIVLLAFVTLVVSNLLVDTTVSAQKPGKNGTTLAAYKTIDICEFTPASDSGPAVWKYSGTIAVWNEGVTDTENFAITDCIQNKVGSGQYQNAYCGSLAGGQITPITPGFTGQIPAGTTQVTATVFKYEVMGLALTGDIRNAATITITNHSGSIGTPKGPEPKATWVGEVLPCGGGETCTCTYSQGYWGNKPGVVWPEGYDRNALFFTSGLTWQQILDTSSAGGNGYIILAHQYIASVLNQANGSCVPSGIEDTLALAKTFFESGATQGTCSGKGSCGLQKDWGATLDEYIQGEYPGSPGHCTSE